MANPPPSQLQGLALPAVKLNGGYFGSRRVYDVSWGDLILALFTPRGSRIMRRSSAGSDISSLIMDPLDAGMAASLKSAVQDVAAQQCPHVRIISVDVKAAQPSGPQSNTRSVEVVVSFTTANDRSQVQTRAARLDRRSVLQVVRAFQVARGGN